MTHPADSFAIHHKCGDPACTIPDHLRLVHVEDNTDRFARAVQEQNAASSAFYAAVAEKHGTAFPVAGTDADDLADMGLEECGECGLVGPLDEVTDCPQWGRCCRACHAGCRQGCEIG